MAKKVTGQVKLQIAAGKATPAPVVIDSGLADIFEEFRIAAEDEQDSPTADYETHYNMGLAYKEMDLLDEAIREFQTAVGLSAPDDDSRHVDARQGGDRPALDAVRDHLLERGRGAGDSKRPLPALQVFVGEGRRRRPIRPLQAFAEDREGNLWIGTTSGISRWNGSLSEALRCEYFAW